MFFHNYKYRIKTILREKEVMFWTLLFPLILATLLNLSTRGFDNIDGFTNIEIAIVNNGEYENKEEFLKVLEGMTIDDEDIFKIDYVNEEKAEELLDNNDIEGYIFFDKDISLAVKESGINETIIKSIIDEFKQTTSTIDRIADENPEALATLDIEEIIERNNYIEEVEISKNQIDSTLNMFYSMIAMTCMYGGFLGAGEIGKIQADKSIKGARVAITAISKLKLSISSMLAALTIQYLNIGIFVSYLYFVLGINFSNQLIYIIITCIVGGLVGVSYGSVIGVFIKRREGLQTAALMVSTMLMSAMAGLMNDRVKYVIDSTNPIINRLNPVNLISESLYALYYYDTLDKFILNIITLIGFSIVFSVVTYLVLRRQKYASL